MKTSSSVITSAWLVAALPYSQKYYLWPKACLCWVSVADWYMVMLDLLFIIFYQKSPAILQFFNLQTTLLRYRDSPSPCTLETDKYPRETATASAVISFCFHTGLCQWQASYSLIFGVPCCPGGFLAALYPPFATARAEPDPCHCSCLRSPGNSCLLICFPGENQETLPLWR